jgi:DNA-binding CsgD family transcriptional regulator
MHWKDDDTRIGRSLFCPAEWTEISESLELTRRECEVVLAVLDDQSDSDIAQELGISANTVHSHIRRVYGKLGVSSRTQLVARVLAEYKRLVSKTKCIVVPSRCPFRMDPP